MKRPTREERQAERERQNSVLRAYGYRWRRTEDLTDTQLSALRDILFQSDEIEEPQWTLLSPLEQPVEKTTILHWLGTHGASSEEVFSFLKGHGFIIMGKDERNIWQIQTPNGDMVNLKQALKALEQKRLDEVAERRRKEEQEWAERFERGVVSLEEILDLYGEAQNDAPAWGYSSNPRAERLPDGTIKVTTYHFEGEWQTKICQTEEQVISYLYTSADGYWYPEEWSHA